MTSLSKLRFNALAGYSRSPYLALTAEELGWFSDGDEKVLGVLIRDIPDQDFSYCILGRDENQRYRAVALDVDIPTQEQARERLAARLAEQAELPPEAFYQYDTAEKPLDFFTPIGKPEGLHPVFSQMLAKERNLPARALLTEMMHYFEDVDGNFIQQFQTTGFDARIWELYLYALFTELGYGFEREHAAPDFHCQGLRGEFFVEATTVNPSNSAPTIDKSNEQAYLEHYVPMKFGSALFSKLKKQYWSLPHAIGHPLIFAIQDFHAPKAMIWSNAALVEYLYGIHQRHKEHADGTREIVSEPITKYVWEGKEIPAGFFAQPTAEYVSAVIANPGGTFSKFSRMGFLAGMGRRDLKMIRRGECFRTGESVEPFVSEVHAPGYTESWCEGLSVYHNPNACYPLDPDTLPGAAHHRIEEGHIVSYHPSFFPLGSITHTLLPKDTSGTSAQSGEQQPIESESET